MSCAPRNTKINRTDRLYLQSDVYTGFGVNNIRTNFLTSAARGFRAPIVDHFLVHISAQVDTLAAGATAIDLMDLVRNVYVRDATGERVNISGTELWMVNTLEHDNRSMHPLRASGGTEQHYMIQGVGATQNNQTRDIWLRIPFRPRKARQRGDFGLPLRELCDVGEFNIDIRNSDFLGATRISSLDSISMRCYAEIYEDRNPELKSRVCYKSYNLAQQEFWFPVNGALRWAGLAMGRKSLVDAALPANWKTQRLTSAGLELYDHPAHIMAAHMLGEHMRAATYGVSGLGQEWSEDPVTNAWFLPIYYPRTDEKLTILPQVESVHFKTDGDIATLVAAGKTPTFLASYVTTRSPAAGALTLGVGSPADALEATNSGTVVASDGKRLPLSDWSPTLVARMPIKVPPTVIRSKE
jgi:hypothetical protein